MPMQGRGGGRGGSSNPFVTSPLEVDEQAAPGPGRFSPEKYPIPIINDSE